VSPPAPPELKRSMLKIIAIVFLLLTPFPIWGQQQSRALSFESWKRGKTRIQPQMLNINVDVSNPTSRAKIKDASSHNKYDLLIEPSKFDKKSSAISFWSVFLYQKESFGSQFLSGDRTTLLKPSNDPYQDSFTTEDYAGWLTPYSDAVVMQGDLVEPCIATPLLLTKRVIKVEGFYIIFQVTNYHFLDRKKNSMESMTIRVEFANDYSG
jgi:hypothetical protein